MTKAFSSLEGFRAHVHEDPEQETYELMQHLSFVMQQLTQKIGIEKTNLILRDIIAQYIISGKVMKQDDVKQLM